MRKSPQLLAVPSAFLDAFEKLLQAAPPPKAPGLDSAPIIQLTK